MKNKEIVVFGQRRSGTSMFAGILFYLGVPMGASAGPHQKSEKNKYGFFEDRDIVKISEEIIQETHDSIEAGKDITLTKLYLKFGKKIRDMLEYKRKNNKVWGFKDVNQVQLHKLYERHLENPYYVFVYRNPIDIAKSLFDWHKERTTFQECIKNVFSNFNTMLGYWKDMKSPVFHASYESARRDPENMVDNIIKFLDIKVTDKQREKAIKHIRK